MIIEDIVLQSAPLDVLWPANCDLTDLSCESLRGIDLVDAQNVTIRGVRTGQQPMTGWGILLREGSRHILVEDVDLKLFFVVAHPLVGVSAVPLGIDDSSHIVVRDATLYGDSAPIWVTDSTDLTFEGGIYDGYLFPAVIERSTRIVVRDVEMRRSLVLVDSSDARVIGNDFQSAHGVQVFDNDWEAPWLAHSILVCGNRIAARLTGLVSANVRDLRVAGNDFVDPTRALDVTAGERIEIDHNRIGPTEYYNLIEAVEDVDLHHNDFVLGQEGLTVVWSTGSAVGNWWGHASGPAPGGAGVPLEIHDLTGGGMPFAPWLEAPPPTTVDCDAIPTPGVS